MNVIAELGGLGSLSAGAILAIVLLAIVTGKLIPENTHDRIVGAKNDQIDTLQAVRSEYRAQNDKLLENDETIIRVMLALDTLLRERADALDPSTQHAAATTPTRAGE